MRTEDHRPHNVANNRETVLRVITDLCEHSMGASRMRVVAVSGLRMAVVDYHVERLIVDGILRRVSTGIFEPVDQTEDRVISATILSRGRTKIEVGDEVLDLSPREGLALAKLLGGLLLAFKAGA
jgi:hypothetical protein